MKRPHVRHIHARPDEHVRVHRAPPAPPPPGPGNWVGALLAGLGPVATLVAGVAAVWAVFKLVAFVLGLITALLQGLCVLLVAYFAFRILAD